MAAIGRPRGRAKTGGTLRPFALLFGVSLAILLLRNTDVLRGASTVGTTALVPLQRALADVGGGVERFAQTIGEIERLRSDNARLRGDNERLQVENVRLREQIVAGTQTAKLEAVARTLPYQAVTADVIARDPSGIVRALVIGAGTDQGVAVGHVVLSEEGVVGRVTQVGPAFAKVVLVTDSSSVVSALVQGSRATGLVRGQYGDSLVMEWVLQTEPVRDGDVVLTAGLGAGEEIRSLYPKGLVLGRVVEVVKAENSAYLRAVLLPAADVRKLERVLVVRTG